MDEYGQAGGLRPAALSNQWGNALELRCPYASLYARRPALVSIRSQHTLAPPGSSIPRYLEAAVSLGVSSEKRLAITRALHLGWAHDWRGTGVEGSRFALCEVSHHDYYAAELRGRCPGLSTGGWLAEAAPNNTRWPPGRKEDGMAGCQGGKVKK